MRNLRVILVCLLSLMMMGGNAFAANPFKVTVTATVSSVTDISVAPLTIPFGTIAGTSTIYRKTAPVAQVSFFPAGAYEVRVWTDNGIGTVVSASTDAKVRGFIRDTATASYHQLFLKVWCPNISANKSISATGGPVLTANTINTDYLWKGFDLNTNGTIDSTPLTTGTYRESGSAVGVTLVTNQDLNGDGTVSTGPTGDIVASASNPVGEDASFEAVREYDTFADAYYSGARELDTALNAQTWRSVLCCSTTGRGDLSLGSPFPVVFATDLMAVYGTVGGVAYTSENNDGVPVTTGATAQKGVYFEVKIY